MTNLYPYRIVYRLCCQVDVAVVAICLDEQDVIRLDKELFLAVLDVNLLSFHYSDALDLLPQRYGIPARMQRI